MIMHFKTSEDALKDVLYNIGYYADAIENKNIDEIMYLVNLYQEEKRTKEEVERAIHYFESVECDLDPLTFCSFVGCEVWDMTVEEYKTVCEEGGI